jgi:hypothetical protein
VVYPFASRHERPGFNPQGGYLCETGILLRALSHYSSIIRGKYIYGPMLQKVSILGIDFLLHFSLLVRPHRQPPDRPQIPGDFCGSGASGQLAFILSDLKYCFSCFQNSRLATRASSTEPPIASRFCDLEAEKLTTAEAEFNALERYIIISSLVLEACGSFYYTLSRKKMVPGDHTMIFAASISSRHWTPTLILT